MRSEDAEALSYLLLVPLFSLLETYRPHIQGRQRRIVLDLVGGGVGLVAVVLSRAELKGLFDQCGIKFIFAGLPFRELPGTLKILVMLLCIDLCLYWIHRAMHTLALWRTHVLHHTIQSMTWLAGLRTSAVHAFFFTLPQVLIPFYVFAATQIEGGLAISGVIFAQIFIHSNINVGLGIVGRWVLVTPNTHRIHHGYGIPRDRNFGSVFIIWDRLFGTWLAPEEVGDCYSLGIGPASDRQAGRVRTLLGI
jgi:sterol desaturase/sphingolipid hydroxylase (fatty acid hydroxylase superfamily)